MYQCALRRFESRPFFSPNGESIQYRKSDLSILLFSLLIDRFDLLIVTML